MRLHAGSLALHAENMFHILQAGPAPLLPGSIQQYAYPRSGACTRPKGVKSSSKSYFGNIGSKKIHFYEIDFLTLFRLLRSV